MTPQKLWVLKAHTKTNKIDDFCQNIRQDFDIYWNIEHQKPLDIDSLKKEKEKHVGLQSVICFHTTH